MFGQTARLGGLISSRGLAQALLHGRDDDRKLIGNDGFDAWGSGTLDQHLLSDGLSDGCFQAHPQIREEQPLLHVGDGGSAIGKRRLLTMEFLTGIQATVS